LRPSPDIFPTKTFLEKIEALQNEWRAMKAFSGNQAHTKPVKVVQIIYFPNNPVK
jgi:hypothetical protein